MPLDAVWYSEQPLHRAIQRYRFAARGPPECETDSRREALNHHLHSDGHRGQCDVHSALSALDFFFQSIIIFRQLFFIQMNGRLPLDAKR